MFLEFLAYRDQLTTAIFCSIVCLEDRLRARGLLTATNVAHISVLGWSKRRVVGRSTPSNDDRVLQKDCTAV